MVAKYWRVDEKKDAEDSWFLLVANNQKNHKLKSQSDFLRIKKHGRKMNISNWLAVAYLTNEVNSVRIGLTIPTYVGTAVLRNKFKRWLRAYLSQNQIYKNKKRSYLNKNKRGN